MKCRPKAGKPQSELDQTEPGCGWGLGTTARLATVLVAPAIVIICFFARASSACMLHIHGPAGSTQTALAIAGQGLQGNLGVVMHVTSVPLIPVPTAVHVVQASLVWCGTKDPVVLGTNLGM